MFFLKYIFYLFSLGLLSPPISGKSSLTLKKMSFFTCFNVMRKKQAIPTGAGNQNYYFKNVGILALLPQTMRIFYDDIIRF